VIIHLPLDGGRVLLGITFLYYNLVASLVTSDRLRIDLYRLPLSLRRALVFEIV
jgi:hypothetical protein